MGKITDDGLVQRFVVFFGKRVGEGVDRIPNHQAIQAYHGVIQDLADMKPAIDIKPITLSEGAQHQRELVQKVARSVSLLPDSSPAFKGHLAKWEGLFPRIALTFHMIENAAYGDGRLEEIISEETAGMAARLMLDFLLPNAARFYQEIVGTGEEPQNVRWIAGYILSHDLEKIAPRDIYRSFRSLRTITTGSFPPCPPWRRPVGLRRFFTRKNPVQPIGR